jgi:hypothetical protein
VAWSPRRYQPGPKSLCCGSCGSFAAYSGSYTSPDTSVSGGNCYRYTFTINDLFGDGICCANGQGGYVIQSSTGHVYAMKKK